jgi:acetylornithine deacetylase/succinyl-diaminopimelate desuccinylase-like protein
MAKWNRAALTEFITQRAGSDAYRRWMIELCSRAVDIDNTPNRPLSEIVRNESVIFDLFENELYRVGGASIVCERQPIDPTIESHPYYTRPYYTADQSHPDGLPAAQTYAGRCNLLAHRQRRGDPSSATSVLVNAHVDTVAPFYGASVKNGYILGRGTVDDKGPCVMMIACLRLIEEIRQHFGDFDSADSVFQFVIEEETGGNGSLSASRDPRCAGYQAIVIEATKLIPHPANRGAMWYRLTMDTQSLGIDLHGVLPYILYRFARLGQQLRDESIDPLFPKSYVQNNLAMLNGFGKHPATISDAVTFDITLSGCDEGAAMKTIVQQAFSDALAEYVTAYVDRTRELDGATRQPRLSEHYSLTPTSPTSFRLDVFGISGHMSTLMLCDNALSKAGYLLHRLAAVVADRHGEMTLHPTDEASIWHRMTISGGVGFTPCHRMDQLQQRLRATVVDAIYEYNRIAHASMPTNVFEMTFDMLHNEAYASPIDCPAMMAFEKSYASLAMEWPTPLAFRASCDARIFANAGHDTVTFGPGDLIDAHGPNERVAIDQLQKGLQLLTLTVMELITGGIDK